MQKVIFDSSFLLAVVERPTTWFEDIVDRVGNFEPTLLDCVRAELQKLAAKSDKKARTARVALDLTSRFASMACGSADVDDEIVSAALSAKALVATTDSALQLSLRSSHVRLVSLRGGRVFVS